MFFQNIEFFSEHFFKPRFEKTGLDRTQLFPDLNLELVKVQVQVSFPQELNLIGSPLEQGCSLILFGFVIKTHERETITVRTKQINKSEMCLFRHLCRGRSHCFVS
jgi:hypothetical protein